MLDAIKKILEDKQEYREQMARAEALPEDYRFVFQKTQGSLWSFASGDGRDMLETQYQLIELLEAGAAQGKQVLEVTGEDVAGFCDELMRGNKLWTDRLRDKLNRRIAERQ